ncbi:MAG: hypothetical protein ABSG54_06330 [Terriglobia bacterium]|jgi:hypothetical protein
MTRRIDNAMLTTNAQWNIENAKLVKRPLYTVFIENLPEALTTFRAEDQQVQFTGYGIGGYGTSGYGY